MIVQSTVAMCSYEDLVTKIKQLSEVLQKANELITNLEKINSQVKQMILIC